MRQGWHGKGALRRREGSCMVLGYNVMTDAFVIIVPKGPRKIPEGYDD